MAFFQGFQHSLSSGSGSLLSSVGLSWGFCWPFLWQDLLSGVSLDIASCQHAFWLAAFFMLSSSLELFPDITKRVSHF